MTDEIEKLAGDAGVSDPHDMTLEHAERFWMLTKKLSMSEFELSELLQSYLDGWAADRANMPMDPP